MFEQAIVRVPGRRLADGLTTAELGPPDHALALAQHVAYVDALRALGLQVLVLEALDGFPDAHFVEDAAVVTPELAVITRPGAVERRGEELAMEAALEAFRPIHRIEAPGTLDGGDVLEVCGQFFIGISGRTNEDGAAQLAGVLARAGHAASTVPVADGLHLKSSVNELGDRRLILSGNLAAMEAFRDYEHTVVAPGEEYACNALHVNGTLLVPAGFPRTRQRLDQLGLPIVELDMSEAQKMDGGLTCLSLRF